MSGFISDIADALTGSASLVLGGMVFTDFALPERMTHGGQQQLTNHKLPGGGRVFDDMGDDPAPVTWSGIWLGLDAAANRAQLEALRTAGDLVDLSWSDQALTVKIANCQYDEEHEGKRIRYRVTCEVMPDAPDDDEGDNGADTADTGTGETPSTASEAKDSGQKQVTRSRSNAAAAPTATRSAAVRSDANAMMAGVDARQAMGTDTRELGAAP